MSMNQKKKQGAGYRSPWVWAMVGLFLVVFAVNYGFVVVSGSTSSGLVNEEYYKYGLQQNKIDEQYRAQAKRGWQVSLPAKSNWHVNKVEKMYLSVLDRAGKPISGRAEITAYRPSDAKADVIIALKESGQSGKYAGELSLPLPGVWDINLLFSAGEEKYVLNRRIEVAGDGVETRSLLEKVVNLITGE